MNEIGNPSVTPGEVFVFVDECHRTQGGKLHRVMKAMMPNAVFVGFTGTPLLVKDKATSMEIFGGYIHTYKFNEAVDDGARRNKNGIPSFARKPRLRESAHAE